ncbi:hypothetical protein NP493_2564g00001 [Ridgeia piscesae]|uniref:Uncharacterized protein n=1 Tax=Ridgeia piscesae TaxID=27915 RepID=A0AAD9JER1_RIDPI|nr:hypothetical protein NP493_2564g00001 [Ridgeia piscesae]
MRTRVSGVCLFSTTAINNNGIKALPCVRPTFIWTLLTLPVHTAPCSSCPHTFPPPS